MLILASNSPRRQELLKLVTKDFVVIASNVSEDKIDLSPKEYATSLALKKACDIYEKNRGNVVIGADTIVVLDDKVLGKPKDKVDAKTMLKALSGRWHEVVTGVAVVTSTKRLTQYEVTKVKFNALSDEFIEQYILSGSPMDKAGAYGIQDSGVCETFEGDYNNVVGLPTNLVAKLLKLAND